LDRRGHGSRMRAHRPGRKSPPRPTPLPSRSMPDASAPTETATRELLVELLGELWRRGWVSGTGGGICGPAEDGGLLLAPSAVHKERVRTDEFFTVDPRDRRGLRSPRLPG